MESRLTWECLAFFLSMLNFWCISHKCLVSRQDQDDCEALKDKSMIYRHIHAVRVRETIYTMPNVHAKKPNNKKRVQERNQFCSHHSGEAMVKAL